MKKHPPLHPHTVDLHQHLLPPEGKVRSARTERVLALITPLHDAFEEIEDQLRETRRKLRRARAEETHIQGTAFFERFKQSCDAADRVMNAVREGITELEQIAVQFDRYAVEWKQSNDSYVTRAPETPLDHPPA